jgi:hypothetical protein
MGQVFHVHGGSVLLDHLAAAGIDGQRLEWCDPVCFGPTPAVDGAEWYRVRSRYLSDGTGSPDVAAVEARLRAQDQALAAIPDGSEVVLWVGPELFCQSILMRLLVLLDPRGADLDVSLVDPGDQPGDKGCGLGNLGPEALRAALEARVAASSDAFALAARAWAAFTAPTADALVQLVAQDPDLSALPHLGTALLRHLDDLPDGALGLSTTELRLLQTLEAGPQQAQALLPALAAREARPFLTDSALDEVLTRLGGLDRQGGGPLIETRPEDRFGMRVAITTRGRDVLAGYEVWDPDRWHGGIHIGVDEEAS